MRCARCGDYVNDKPPPPRFCPGCGVEFEDGVDTMSIQVDDRITKVEQQEYRTWMSDLSKCFRGGGSVYGDVPSKLRRLADLLDPPKSNSNWKLYLFCFALGILLSKIYDWLF